MNKKDKLLFIVSTLDDLYSDPPIPLAHSNPYTLLIAVLLSAQCTDARVNQVTPNLFALADNPSDMVLQDVNTIREIIKPCGLSNTKSKAIYNLSKILINSHDKMVPSNLFELEKLPGVGHKTASVVMSQAFNVPTFPVDTHIHRLSYRWCISTGKNVTKTELDCKNFFPRHIWNKLHLQMIYFGREYCPARGHHVLNCPICSVVGRKSLFN